MKNQSIGTKIQRETSFISSITSFTEELDRYDDKYRLSSRLFEICKTFQAVVSTHSGDRLKIDILANPGKNAAVIDEVPLASEYQAVEFCLHHAKTANTVFISVSDHLGRAAVKVMTGLDQVDYRIDEMEYGTMEEAGEKLKDILVKWVRVRLASYFVVEQNGR